MQEILKEIMRLNRSYSGYKGSRFRWILLYLKDCQGPCKVIVKQLLKILPIDFWNETSTDDESFSDGLLEHPQYTRPREFMGLSVPEVLLNGNHKEIEKWRNEQKILETKKYRPDLLKK